PRAKELVAAKGGTLEAGEALAALVTGQATVAGTEVEVVSDGDLAGLASWLKSLAGADSIAREEPAGFVGSLRHYQKRGLGWLSELAARGLGACLADDMGLGKTVQ